MTHEPEGPGVAPGGDDAAQPDRPKYTPPSFVPPVTLSKKGGQPTEPIGNSTTEPIPPYPQPSYAQPHAYGQPGYPGFYGQGYGQAGYVAEPMGLSIASMVCGICVYAGFGIFLIPQIAAVILGHMALSREPAGRGMALAGLVMGYVGLALTVLGIALVAIVVGSLASHPGYTRSV